MMFSFFCHGLCVGGYETGDGVNVNSTFGIVLDHLQSIVSSTLEDGLGYYGIDLIESKIMPMGASTLQRIELQKDNRTFSARKSYTCKMDTMFSTVCMMCNINKFECYKYVTLSLFNLYIESVKN